MKIKTLIIDEERTALTGLENQLRNATSDLDIIGNAYGIEDGYNLICHSNPDLVFLDANFSNGTGFDLLNRFEKVDFKVVITTSCDEFAMEAFRVNALDYLLKPIDCQALDLTVTKISTSFEEREKFEKINAFFKGYFVKSFQNRKLAIKESRSINYIDIDDIMHLKADGNYTNIILKSGKHYVSSKVLKHYDTILSDYGFLRVHRSNMVNLNYVKEFRHRYGGSIVMQNNDEVSIAPDKKKDFFKRLGMI